MTSTRKVNHLSTAAAGRGSSNHATRSLALHGHGRSANGVRVHVNGAPNTLTVIVDSNRASSKKVIVIEDSPPLPAPRTVVMIEDSPPASSARRITIERGDSPSPTDEFDDPQELTSNLSSLYITPPRQTLNTAEDCIYQGPSEERLGDQSSAAVQTSNVSQLRSENALLLNLTTPQYQLSVASNERSAEISPDNEPTALEQQQQPIAQNIMGPTSFGPRQRWPFYVVFQGRRPGIYSEWRRCSIQVKPFPDALFRGFATREQADRLYQFATRHDLLRSTLTLTTPTGALIRNILEVNISDADEDREEYHEDFENVERRLEQRDRYYSVPIGHRPGLYSTLLEAQLNAYGVVGGAESYRSHPTRDRALRCLEEAIEAGVVRHLRQITP